MIRQLLTALFGCDHADAVRKRVDGSYFLECSCGHVAELVQRTKAERRKMKAQYPAVELPKAQRVTKPNVESIRKRQA